MTKTALLLWVLLLAGLFAGPAAHAQAPCVSQTNAGAAFEAYDAATGQLLPKLLCVGRPVRLRDRSGKNFKLAEIYYRQGTTTICTGFNNDTTTTFTPAAVGALVITQNTPGVDANSPGIIFSKTYEVLATPQPTFELSVCSPGLVQVTVTDASYATYFVQVGSGAPVLAERGVAVSYPISGGPNTVTVTGRNAQVGVCEGTSTKPFTPLPPPQRPVVRRLTRPAEGTVQLEFEALQPEYLYQLQVAEAAAPGGYRNLTAVTAASTTLTLPAAPLPGCYRLLLQDQCEPTVFSLPSNEICSVQLDGAATNGSNQLSWTSAGSGTYTLTRTEGSTSVVLPLPPGATSYTDAAVSCGTTYRYQVSLGSGPATSVSNEISLTALSTTPPARPRLWAGFNLRNQVELRAEVPGLAIGGQLRYQRNGAPLAATPARRLLDSLVTPDPAVPLCYAVEFQDACGNRAPAGASVCIVQLVAEVPNPNGPEIRLTWSALTVTGPDPAAPVSYQVLGLAADNAVVSSVPVGAALTYLDLQPDPNRQTVRYRIEARGVGLVEPSYSNVAEVTRPVKLVLPTAFTPNGDGLNDVLELKGRFLDSFRFTIIDRNGQTVFETTDRTRGWDGRIKGAVPVPGAYAWQFEALDQRGQRVRQYGSVTILR
ncbi:T9SS type B sorting domain-containing protein [Hymenobacter psychrophilus]|uniref:Gliding motility-associated C-terminal domain-containing protein n=1 Tax=Hymenobacter psychrophilus TaxID=651662 RepID=A0A1H3NLA2_9BACT|nr:gliding motility-associated C-terminal domain-containing protein [Hymenobacter psychrophilus]SDY89205.1 gliding motility-associated C-terminal domain-containing protein [Hymenobacter psychrophilus]